MEPTKYLRTEAAAAYLGVSKRTLEKWRRNGVGGPVFVRLGRRLVAYTRDALDSWAKRDSAA